MQNNQTDYFVKDVHVFNERTIVKSDQNIRLIIGNSTSSEVIESCIKNPYTMDKITTFSIQDTTGANQLPVNSFNSVRNIVKTIRNSLLNGYYAFSSAEKFDTAVFDLRGIEPNNIAHLIIHAIPLCLLVRNSAGLDTQFLFRKMGAPFEKLLNEFGIKPITSNKKIEANFVKVFGTRNIAGHVIQLAGLNILDAKECLHSSVLPDTYNDYQFKSPLKNKKKIFIARRGARALINHDETQILLTEHGYETVFMEDYSISEQLGIASEVTHVVGVHGASMGMLVLNKKIESLIEILPPNAYNDYFAVALATCVKKHIQIIPSFDSRVLFNGWTAIEHFKNKPFSVNLVQLKLALNQLET